MSIERRRFLISTSVIAGSVALGTSGCGLGRSTMPELRAGYRVEGRKLVLELDRVPELAAVGGTAKLMVRTSSEFKVAVARLTTDSYLAFENRCTHGGNELDYRADAKDLRCASLGHSRFDLSGHVLEGPAAQALRVLPCRLVDRQLEIELPA